MEPRHEPRLPYGPWHSGRSCLDQLLPPVPGTCRLWRLQEVRCGSRNAQDDARPLPADQEHAGQLRHQPVGILLSHGPLQALLSPKLCTGTCTSWGCFTLAVYCSAAIHLTASGPFFLRIKYGMRGAVPRVVIPSQPGIRSKVPYWSGGMVAYYQGVATTFR